jgi:hypothetical protein
VEVEDPGGVEADDLAIEDQLLKPLESMQVPHSWHTPETTGAEAVDPEIL